MGILLWGFRVFEVMAAPPRLRVQYVPDDAYYYLTLARNFVHHGIWSFDSGVSLTSGFHLLHGYALAAIYAMSAPSEEAFVEAGTWLSASVAVVPVLLAAAFAFRSGRLMPALVFTVLLTSRNVFLNSISTVEWSWVVSLSSIYLLSFPLDRKDCPTSRAAWLASIGFVGSLARTDFGILPAGFAMAALASSLARGAIDSRSRAALLGLGGSVIGVATTMLHNQVLTGDYLQSSARMKSRWLATYGPSPTPFLMKASSLFGSASPVTLGLASLLLAVALVVGVRRLPFLRPMRPTRAAGPGATNTPQRDAIAWWGSGTVMAGYVILYSFNPGGIQHWYTAGLARIPHQAD